MKRGSARLAERPKWLGVAVLLCLAAIGCRDAEEEVPAERTRRPKVQEQAPPDYSQYTEGKPLTSREQANAIPRQRPGRGSLAAAPVGPRKNRDEVAAFHLRAIGQGINVYRKWHKKYPLTLRNLIDEGLTVNRYLESARDSKRRMVYRRPEESAPENMLMVYDPVPNDQGKVMVLLVGRQTALVEQGELERMLKRD